MEELNSSFGGLLQFKNNQEITLFLENMDKKQAFTIIETALFFSQKQGTYSFDESHIIYKCLNKLKENEKNNTSNDLPNSNNNGDSDK